MSIEHNIPMPQPHKKYPFGEMGVGDSFTRPLEDRGRVGTAAYKREQRTGEKYSIRRQGDIIRCWRVK